MNSINQCKTCNATLNGLYCSQCGEKVLEDRDFAFTKIVGDAFSSFTNLDSKLYQTIKAIFFAPGKLTKAYLDGRRTQFMKPFQLFIIASILFFIFFSNEDLFLIPSNQFSYKTVFEINLNEIVAKRVAAKGITEEAFLQAYDAKIAANSKLYILATIPVIAFISLLLNYRNMNQYGKHIIFTLHNISFMMLFFVSFLFITQVISLLFKGNKVLLVLFCIAIYYLIAIKKVFDQSWPISVIKSLGYTIFLFITIFSYRILISIFTLYTI